MYHDRQIEKHIVKLIDLLAPASADRSTLDELRALVAREERWETEARDLFHCVRSKNLVLERKPNRVLEAQYCFEEVCAKTLYNLTHGPAPYDPDSPYWILPLAIDAAKQLGIEPSQVIAILDDE